MSDNLKEQMASLDDELSRFVNRIRSIEDLIVSLKEEIHLIEQDISMTRAARTKLQQYELFQEQ